MSTLIEGFEKACIAAHVAPTAALKRAGLHPSTWFRWKSGEVSPTLRSFEAATAALDEIVREQPAPESEKRAITTSAGGAA